MIERKNETLWVEKYRPRTLDDCILPKKTKEDLRAFIEKGDIPNLIFHSRVSGVGKTTLARVLGEQMGFDVLFINASLENGIDVLRNKIATFASTVSLVASKKCVILDEADNLSQSMQPALRGFIEQFSTNVRFIFTCNYVNKLLPAILSRCAVIDFNIPSGERQELMRESLRRVEYILKAEGKEYDRKAVAKVLKLHFPDLRRTINDLARYSGNGRIDEDILINMSHNNFSLLIKHLKERNFKELRLWVANNKDIEPSAIFTFFYENASKFMKPESIPQLIITTDRYQFQAAFVVDQEINVAAYLTEVMANCQFLQTE